MIRLIIQGKHTFVKEVSQILKFYACTLAPIYLKTFFNRQVALRVTVAGSTPFRGMCKITQIEMI
jgi:hypothetical protein